VILTNPRNHRNHCKPDGLCGTQSGHEAPIFGRRMVNVDATREVWRQRFARPRLLPDARIPIREGHPNCMISTVDVVGG
jgi:hypothetical protein